MRKIRIIVSLVIIATFVMHTFASGTGPNVFVNGRKIDTESLLMNDKTYIPLRAVSEALGAEVNWNELTNSAEISTSSGSLDQLIPEVIKKVSPSVVAIIGNYSNSTSSYQDKYSEGTGGGTGVIIKSGGEILTNAHVVDDIKNLVVVLADGTAYEGKVKYFDESSDLAVVKIDKIGLPVATFAKDEDIITGKTVIAIGNPVSFSLRNSATSGIISGINRGLFSDYRLIQTDAAINPGNSGGPLINLKGEVVGINSSKFAAVGIEGMCFSIPVNTVKYVLKHFDAYGMVKRPQIGAEFEESWAAKRGLPTKDGITFKKIEEGSAAKSVGIKEGNVLLAVDDTPITSIIDLNECYKNYLPQSSAVLTIKDGSETKKVTIQFK